MAPLRSLPAAAAAQLTLTLVALAAALLVPPREGAMLLVPLGSVPLAATLDLATAHGAALLGIGPLGHAVVRGDRAALLGPLLAHGVVPVAAPARWCGA